MLDDSNSCTAVVQFQRDRQADQPSADYDNIRGQV
jgi:hypothetical protein